MNNFTTQSGYSVYLAYEDITGAYRNDLHPNTQAAIAWAKNTSLQTFTIIPLVDTIVPNEYNGLSPLNA